MFWCLVNLYIGAFCVGCALFVVWCGSLCIGVVCTGVSLHAPTHVSAFHGSVVRNRCVGRPRRRIPLFSAQRGGGAGVRESVRRVRGGAAGGAVPAAGRLQRPPERQPPRRQRQRGGAAGRGGLIGCVP